MPASIRRRPSSSTGRCRPASRNTTSSRSCSTPPPDRSRRVRHDLQFTKLRLSGFKSFVEPTELLIEPGLTGIVGPNGCGKSNLVEALQWVMGETSARRLRGGDMDDVIFGGTTTKPARNVASVSVRMDNA